mgnify:CR=1 FL=1
MPHSPALGLRDRKRIETRLRIETAAVEIVTAEGLDGATIDMISERAEISPRTFFNYFESKEDAILGIQEIGEVQRAIASGVASAETDDLVSAIVVATCVASIRIAIKEWIADGATADIDSMYLRAVGLTRETLTTLK